MKPIWEIAKTFNHQSIAMNGHSTVTVRRPSNLYLAQKELSSISKEVSAKDDTDEEAIFSGQTTESVSRQSAKNKAVDTEKISKLIGEVFGA